MYALGGFCFADGRGYSTVGESARKRVGFRGVHVHPRDSEMNFYFTASTPLVTLSWRSEKVVLG